MSTSSAPMRVYRTMRGGLTPSAKTVSLLRDIKSRKLSGETLTVPIAALVGNIVVRPMGSAGPEFVPLDVLSESVNLWSLQPIVYNHPSTSDGSAKHPSVLSTSQLGVIGSPRMLNSSLVVDGCLGIPLLAQRAKAVLDRLESGDNIEVSIGAYITIRKESGVYDGTAYEYKWQKIEEADHLAILSPGSVGACSNSAGCGVHKLSVHCAQCGGVKGVTQPVVSNPTNSKKEEVKNMSQANSGLQSIFRINDADNSVTTNELPLPHTTKLHLAARICKAVESQVGRPTDATIEQMAALSDDTLVKLAVANNVQFILNHDGTIHRRPDPWGIVKKDDFYDKYW